MITILWLGEETLSCFKIFPKKSNLNQCFNFSIADTIFLLFCYGKCVYNIVLPPLQFLNTRFTRVIHMCSIN